MIFTKYLIQYGFGCIFYLLLYLKEGTSANVGSVMSKGFYKKFEEGIIRPTRFQSQFHDLFGSSKRTKHWTNYRLAIWLYCIMYKF